MASTSSAELKQRLERAKRRSMDRDSHRAVDESGVRPLQREDPGQALEQPGAPPPVSLVRPAVEVEAVAVSGRRRAIGRVARGVALIAAGAVLGGTVMWLFQPRLSTLQQATAASAAKQTADAKPGESKAQAGVIDIASQPSGAEVVLRSAVIGNTPLRVSRPSYDVLYLLRRSGYYPQLVRVSTQTGDTIVVALRPLADEALPSAPVVDDPGPKSKSDPVERTRGHDVGRESTLGRSDGPAVGRSSR